jgi:hypothetical protein
MTVQEIARELYPHLFDDANHPLPPSARRVRDDERFNDPAFRLEQVDRLFDPTINLVYMEDWFIHQYCEGELEKDPRAMASRAINQRIRENLEEAERIDRELREWVRPLREAAVSVLDCMNNADPKKIALKTAAITSSALGALYFFLRATGRI